MKALIIANGAMPHVKSVRALAKSADVIVCADGGANHARALGVTPDVILGDFDSILPATKKYYRGIPQLHIEEQESTDLEKAISFCIERKYDDADVVGATGDRIDHLIGSLGCFKRFGERIRLQFIDDVGVMTLVRGKLSLDVEPGEKISLIPLERCTGVTTRNFKYPLRDEVLELGVREGTSNQAVGRKISVSVRSGTLLLYRFHPRFLKKRRQ